MRGVTFGCVPETVEGELPSGQADPPSAHSRGDMRTWIFRILVNIAKTRAVKEQRTIVTDYLEGALDQERREMVEAHLRTCHGLPGVSGADARDQGIPRPRPVRPGERRYLDRRRAILSRFTSTSTASRAGAWAHHIRPDGPA